MITAVLPLVAFLESLNSYDVTTTAISSAKSIILYTKMQMVDLFTCYVPVGFSVVWLKEAGTQQAIIGKSAESFQLSRQ